MQLSACMMFPSKQEGQGTGVCYRFRTTKWHIYIPGYSQSEVDKHQYSWQQPA